MVIRWNGLVSADRADQASFTLVRLLFEEKMTVGAAVNEPMLQIADDPDFDSSLTFHRADHSPDRILLT